MERFPTAGVIYRIEKNVEKMYFSVKHAAKMLHLLLLSNVI